MQPRRQSVHASEGLLRIVVNGDSRNAKRNKQNMPGGELTVNEHREGLHSWRKKRRKVICY